MLRHEDYQLRWYVDDREFGPISVTDFSADPDMRIDSSKPMGKDRPVKDSTHNGYNFSFTLEVANGDADMIRAFEQYERGQDREDGTGRTEFVVRKRVNQVEIEAHRYTGVHWTIGESSRESGRATRQIRGEAERRVRI